MHLVQNSILSVLFFLVSACVTTHDLVETHNQKTSSAKKNQTNAGQKNLAQPSPVAENSVIKSETIHSDPIVPFEAKQSAPAATMSAVPATQIFFSVPKKESLPKTKSTEKFSTDSKKVGAILPLTGKNASVGQRALTALRLGLGLNEASPKLSLVLFDSQGSPELASQGVEKLLIENGVVAIFGGLGAKEALAISEKADFYEIPFFTFSQKSGLTDNSDFTFRNAITAEMQVDKLAEFLFDKLTYKRFAILYPNDAYGVEFANKFWDQVLARGGQVTAAQAYDPKSSDLNVYIQKLVGTYYLDDRKQEYKDKLKELKEKKDKKLADGFKKNSRENDAKENLLEPIVDFDAIFIPDSGKVLGQAMAFLKSNDVQNLTYLGTNIWNTPDLVRRAGAHNQHIYFVDSNSSQAENATSDFYKKYFAINQEEPQLLEAQTYESAKIVHDILAGFGSVSRESLASQLRSLGRRNGAYGEIRMNNSKEIERELSILTIDQGQIIKNN